MAESLLSLKTIAKTWDLGAEQNLTVLDQRHLRRQVITLEDFNMVPVITETNVIRPSIITGSDQPEGVHSRPLRGQHSGDRDDWPRLNSSHK